MKFSVENESLSETTSMFCSREKLIGLKVIQQNEKSTQKMYMYMYFFLSWVIQLEDLC